MSDQIETAAEGLAAVAEGPLANVPENPPANQAGAAPDVQAANADKPAGNPAAPASAEQGAPANTAAPAPLDQPISDWSRVNLKLPEGMEADPALMESLGKVAIKAGLTERQAQELVAWNVETMLKAQDQLREAGISALREAWGAQAGQNQQAVVGLVSRIDRAMQESGAASGAFTKALAECGADLRPDIMKGLFEVSRWLSEDSLGKTAGMGGSDRPETAIEGLQAALEAARAGRA